jgi:hypothetical protein
MAGGPTMWNENEEKKMTVDPPATAVIIDQIRRLVSPLGAEERLALIQAIADMEPGSTVQNDAPPPTRRRDRLSAEQAAWYARSPDERAHYRGQFVAVRNGQVVDHDPDRRALYLRVRARFGHTPVLIIPAHWDETPVYTIHSPLNALLPTPSDSLASRRTK